MKKLLFLLMLFVSCADIASENNKHDLHHQEMEKLVLRWMGIFQKIKQDPAVLKAIEQLMEANVALARVTSKSIRQSLTEKEKAKVIEIFDFIIDFFDDATFKKVMSRGNMEAMSQQEQAYLGSKCMALAPLFENYGMELIKVLASTFMETKTVTVNQAGKTRDYMTIKPEYSSHIVHYSLDQWVTILKEMKETLQA